MLVCLLSYHSQCCQLDRFPKENDAYIKIVHEDFVTLKTTFTVWKQQYLRCLIRKGASVCLCFIPMLFVHRTCTIIDVISSGLVFYNAFIVQHFYTPNTPPAPKNQARPITLLSYFFSLKVHDTISGNQCIYSIK